MNYKETTRKHGAVKEMICTELFTAAKKSEALLRQCQHGFPLSKKSYSPREVASQPGE
jgi:hypothetical protein